MDGRRKGASLRSIGFAAYKRTDVDEEGNPYPLLYMKNKQE